jgi:hypothetical protein
VLYSGCFIIIFVIYLGTGCKWHKNVIFVVNIKSFIQLIHLLCTLETIHFHDSCNTGFPFNHNWFLFYAIWCNCSWNTYWHDNPHVIILGSGGANECNFFYYEWCYGLLLQCRILLLNVLHWLVSHDYYWYYVLRWSNYKIQNNFKSLCCEKFYCFLLNNNLCSQRQVW